jgi:diguanylate cyclase (GGDEF)-like protein
VSVSRPTRHYPEVQIQEGLGWVDLAGSKVVMPPKGKKPRGTKKAPPQGFLFHVVEIPTPVAVLTTGAHGESDEKEDEHRAVDLLLDHVEQVAWVDAEADGVALGEAYSDDSPSAANAACAMAIVKVAGGKGKIEGPLVFNVKGEQSNTVTVDLKKAEAGFEATTRTPRTGSDDILKSVKEYLRLANGCSLVLANVDHTMAINDRHGFQFGDLVLARIHRLFEIEEPDSDGEFYRVGGDDFAILIPGSNTRKTDALAERLRAGAADMEIPIDVENDKGDGVNHVTLSVGVVHVPPDARRSPKEVWQIAQFTIWKAKDSGRNAIKVAAAI